MLFRSSYIPNWYIAENNFFYSGINACCDDAVFEAFAAVVTPPEETTTTTSTERPATTSTTTTLLDCTIEGTAEIVGCTLEGVAYITEPPAPPPCQRPTNLQLYSFVYGYAPSTGPSIISSLTSTDACLAVGAVFESGATPLLFTVSAANLFIGQTVYFGGIGITDCNTLGDGWYFVNNSTSIGTIYNVVGGVIVEIFTCPNYTTTTTSTTIIGSRVFLGYGIDSATACAASQTAYYVNPLCVPLALGCTIYTDLTLTTAVSVSGFYSNGAYSYECNSSGVIIDVLLCT